MAAPDPFLVHGNNIQQKLRTAQGADGDLAKQVFDRYQTFLSNLEIEATLKDDFEKSVSALEEYVTYTKQVEKVSRFFNWRSNFAGSVIPEFFFRVLSIRLTHLGLTHSFSTKDSVVEATISDSGIHIRHKDQDLCIGVRQEQMALQNGEVVRFVVPAVCCEVKTNIDINKLNGLDFSAERLKRTFPSARYLLITETIDFSLDNNYAAGYLDEVYVLRKQVRSLARRSKDKLCPDVFSAVAKDIEATIRAASVKRVHVYERLVNGRLIGV